MSNSRRKCQNPKCSKIEPQFGTFKVCAKCKAIPYCSIECQKIDWKNNHKNDCKIPGYFDLKFYLESKTSVNNLKDTRGERIARYAFDFFTKYATKSTEQIIIVKINRTYNTAEFTICENDIKIIKNRCNFKPITKNCLYIYVVDLENDSIEILSINKIEVFNSLISASDVINL